jgi:hypothetical protein
MVLAGGWLFAGLLAGLVLLLGGSWAAYVVGGPIALIYTALAYLLLRSGRELKKSGDDAEQATKNQAIFALANTKSGVLKAWDVAQALQISPKEGDDILTRLAKEHPDYVAVDIDDDGNVLYRFLRGIAPNAPAAALRPPPPPLAPIRVAAAETLEDEAELESAELEQKAH